MLYQSLRQLLDYALRKKLIEKEDELYCANRLLALFGLDEWKEPETADDNRPPLAVILGSLGEEAAKRGLIGDGITERDIFDTELMAVLTPRPSEVIRDFRERYELSPESATDAYYAFSCDTNYIRRDRIERDEKWKTETPYGTLDITINLSKPEKDPKAIAAALKASPVGYPKCQLCPENEGYKGRLTHPARGNHRMIPLTLCGESWYLQYSPYVYYNEHCIVLNAKHIPMSISERTFRLLLEFVSRFPHYFLGSNADLPIVGGSILTHDHFQGGRYSFAMDRAPIETPLSFRGFEDVECGIVRWPMSVIRLRHPEKERLIPLADKILRVWRGYTDEESTVYAFTDGMPHNTVTPIARYQKKDGCFELDLVLRNNLTTKEHPLGLYHPHEELHHIKKENIGLIEVMGLAVLPARLKNEIRLLEEAILAGKDPAEDPAIASHAAWAAEVRKRHPVLDKENIHAVFQEEIGKVFSKVLACAGVYKRDEKGKAGFLRFADAVNKT